MNHSPRRLLVSIFLLLGLLSAAQAQDYPNKPVRLIVPFPAGGGSDVIARILAQKLGERLGQQVVVDNRAGAGGAIGTEAAARSTPDGYTLVLASTSEIAVNPAVYSKLSYDTLKDLVPVALVASTPMVVVVTPSLPVNSLAELIGYAKAKPGEFNVGSAGNGSFTHLASELFRSTNGLAWTHVPYKGAPPALTDLAAGRIQAMFSTVPAAMTLIKSNLIRPIAVSSQTRDANMPGVPTVLESGIASYDVRYWYGVFAPAGTPRDVVARLAESISLVVKSQDVIDSLAKQGADPGTMSSSQFAGYLRTEVDKWGKVVKDSGAKID